jgi:hypothetical protein
LHGALLARNCAERARMACNAFECVFLDALIEARRKGVPSIA